MEQEAPFGEAERKSIEPFINQSNPEIPPNQQLRLKLFPKILSCKRRDIQKNPSRDTSCGQKARG